MGKGPGRPHSVRVGVRAVLICCEGGPDRAILKAGGLGGSGSGGWGKLAGAGGLRAGCQDHGCWSEGRRSYGGVGPGQAGLGTST